jgi:DNA repair protein RadC
MLVRYKSNAELYSAILGKSSNKVAEMPLEELFGTEDTAELQAHYGLTEAEAEKLMGSAELARKIVSAACDDMLRCGNPQDVACHLMPHMRHLQHEEFWVLCLNAKNRLISEHCVFVGSLTDVPVHCREVFIPAIARRSAAIIVAHNHPSGDCTPSAADNTVTTQLFKAGKILDIPVLDHIIVGGADYYSYRENNALVYKEETK